MNSSGRPLLAFTAKQPQCPRPTMAAGSGVRFVSTNEGLLAFTGRSTQGAAFTPVNPATLPPDIKPGSSPNRVPAASVESAGEDQGGTIVQRANGLLPSASPAGRSGFH